MKWITDTVGAKGMNDAGANTVFSWFHKGLALVYLVAFVPMFFELEVLIGTNGFQPAKNLLDISYKDQGALASLFQFPSLFHIYPDNITLYILITLGCIGGIGLLLGFRIFWSSFIAWFSFLSITSVGGDFFSIIIDLFLSEAGFLALFSAYFLQYKGYVPNVVSFAFKLLNFKLWFSMGVIKFYMPLTTWASLTFFDTFFQAQPMPTPMATVFHQAPYSLKVLATVFLFAGEIIVPFFVFGNRLLRWLSVITFVVISVLIQLNGNYGYFNVLSIILAITILKTSDLNVRENISAIHLSTPKNPFIRFVLIPQLVLQLVYCLLLFHPKPFSYQNHFNFIHTYIKSENAVVKVFLYPFKLVSYWRICNPYGVFKGIPCYHAEIRISGSADSIIWKPYQFKFLPSGQTDYLGFYAPYYPRLDHLMFYETLSETNAKNNTLNPYYSALPPWSCTFIKQLFTNKKQINILLKHNPFEGTYQPNFIKTELYRLSFSDEADKNWIAEKQPFEKIYTINSACTKALIPHSVAMKTVSD